MTHGTSYPRVMAHGHPGPQVPANPDPLHLDRIQGGLTAHSISALVNLKAPCSGS